MASYTTTTKDAQTNRAIRRDASPSFRPLQQGLRYAIFSYTFAGTEADTEVITLGSLGVEGAKVIPELSCIRDTGGTGENITVDLKLNALVDGETDTDLTGTVALDNNRVAFTGVAGASLTSLKATDDLRLIVDDDSIGAVTAGETINIEIAYVSENYQ